MIVKKTWEREARDSGAPDGNRFTGGGDWIPQYLDIYTGWFLLGVIPIYIVRERTRK